MRTAECPQYVQPRPSQWHTTTAGWWLTFSDTQRRPRAESASSKVSSSIGLNGFSVRVGGAEL